MEARQLADELTCPICYEVMRGPTSLPCNHSFCGECLGGLPVENGAIKCPSCRKRSRQPGAGTSRPENKQLSYVCEMARKIEKTLCESERRRASNERPLNLTPRPRTPPAPPALLAPRG